MSIWDSLCLESNLLQGLGSHLQCLPCSRRGAKYTSLVKNLDSPKGHLTLGKSCANIRKVKIKLYLEIIILNYYFNLKIHILHDYIKCYFKLQFFSIFSISCICTLEQSQTTLQRFYIFSNVK